MSALEIGRVFKVHKSLVLAGVTELALETERSAVRFLLPAAFTNRVLRRLRTHSETFLQESQSTDLKSHTRAPFELALSLLQTGQREWGSK